MKNLEKYNIPSFDCPVDYSRFHKEELRHVSNAYDSSHLSNKFLNLSHKSDIGYIILNYVVYQFGGNFYTLNLIIAIFNIFCLLKKVS